MEAIDQFVILNHDGTYHFSPNLPISESKPVVGVFHCSDAITDRFTFKRYIPTVEIKGLTVGKKYEPLCENGDAVLVVDDNGCRVIVSTSALVEAK